jgi:hypothetical protein
MTRGGRVPTMSNTALSTVHEGDDETCASMSMLSIASSRCSPEERQERARHKAWLDASCLPAVRALVVRKGYAGKVVQIDTNEFCIDESRVLRHTRQYPQLVTYVGQLHDYTEVQARNLWRQLVAHVQTLHEHGVLHRDLHPDDIYVVEVCYQW